MEHLTKEQQERIQKFSDICFILKTYNIELDRSKPIGNIVFLVDRDTNKTLGHNLMTWQVFPVQKVVNMVLSWKKNNLTTSST